MAADPPKKRRRRQAATMKLTAPEGKVELFLEAFAMRVTTWAGGSWAFALAFLVIIIWGLTGPIFKFSDTWQLVVNTGTTIVTFLMVFLIQRSQNKESKAVQLKLNEIVAALEGASNRLIDIEDLSEGELNVLRRHYQKLSDMAEDCEDITESHSVEEATRRHTYKWERGKESKGRKERKEQAG